MPMVPSLPSRVKWLGAPDGVSYKNNVGQHIIDPYASEQPKFVITADMAQYAKFLTDGQEKCSKSITILSKSLVPRT